MRKRRDAAAAPSAAHYDRLARGYERRWAAYLQRTLTAVVDALPLRGDERILDVACGTGLLIAMLRQRCPGTRITGIDSSPAMLDQAKRRFEGVPSVRLELARAEALPFAAAAFDAVVCANAVHALQDPGRFFNECARALRPSGRLVIVDLRRDAWTSAILHAWLRVTGRADIRMLRVRELVDALRAAGFSVERVDRFTVLPWYGMMRVMAQRCEGRSEGATE